MQAIYIPAHFDGERIQLDADVTLEQNARLLVTVLPSKDTEREDWIRLSLRGLASAYGPDEPDYGSEDIIETKTNDDSR